MKEREFDREGRREQGYKTKMTMTDVKRAGTKISNMVSKEKDSYVLMGCRSITARGYRNKKEGFRRKQKKSELKNDIYMSTPKLL